MLGQCRSAIVDQRGAEAAAAEITGEDDVYREHLDSNIRVIPGKPPSGPTFGRPKDKLAAPIRNPS